MTKHITSLSLDTKINDADIVKHRILSALRNFYVDSISLEDDKKGNCIYKVRGELKDSSEDVNDSSVHICNKCGNRTHINNKYTVNLKHLRITGKYTCISFIRKQYRCISCSETESGEVDFKANGYRITKHLYNYIFDLLAFKQFTYRDVSVLTGLGQNTIKSIYSDREQKYPKLPLHNHYMHNDEVLKKPKKYSDNILIYEDFFAHLNENVLQVVDFDTGHLIWIGFDTEKIPEIDGFLSFVGEDWMKHLKNVIVDDTIKSIDALDSRYPDLDIHVYKS